MTEKDLSEAAKVIICTSPLWLTALGAGVITTWAHIRDWLDTRHAAAQTRRLMRATQGLPEHVRCGCDVCAAWRKARYG